MTAARFVVAGTSNNGATALIVIEGEIDASNLADFAECVTSGLATDCSILTMDMAGLTFIDSSGVRVIVEAMKTLRQRGGRLVLKDPPSIVRRILEVSGLAQFLGLEGEAPQAG